MLISRNPVLMLRRTLLIAITALLLTGCMLKPGSATDKLNYSLPTTVTIAIGEALPGTDVRYLRMDDDGAYLMIKGQQALKLVGDSVDWKGNLQEGVSVDLSLRIVSFDEAEIHLAGVAKIALSGVSPKAGNVMTDSPIQYSGPVAYNLAKGAMIPGTEISYQERTDEGARLGGIEGYAYRKAGDSILWEGSLRPEVYVRLSLRVVQYDDNGLRVAGVVTLWFGS